MKNSLLKQYEYADVSNFTTDAGIKIRRIVNPLWRALLKNKPDECKTLQDYLRQKAGLPYEQIEKCTMEELGIDSLESMEICVWVEEKYGICLDDILKPSVSVEEVLKYLENAHMNEPVNRKHSMVFYQFVRRMVHMPNNIQSNTIGRLSPC